MWWWSAAARPAKKRPRGPRRSSVGWRWSRTGSVGGECGHWACIPSKALLRPPEVLAGAGRIRGARESLNGGPNVAAVLARRDEVIGVDEHTGEPDDAFLMPWGQSHRIALVRGRGRLTGERRVTVGDEELEARKAVILSGGSEPLLPPIDGLEDVEGVWTNREAADDQGDPAPHGSSWGRAGRPRAGTGVPETGQPGHAHRGRAPVLPNHEEFARVQLTTALGQDGVEILTGRRVVRLGRNGDAYVVTTSDDGAAEADRVLVAVGRKAPTDDIGLQNVGLNPGGFLEVDEHMRVRGVSWLYAAGDISGRAQFTHMGKYQARIAVDHFLGDETAVAHGADGAQAPHVIFTDPQVVSVGHTTESATAAGIDFDVYDTETSANLGGLFYAPNAPGDGALPRPPRAARADRLHDHRVPGGRLPARGHDRCGRRGAARAPAPRGAALPDTQRAVAVTARTGRRLRC